MKRSDTRVGRRSIRGGQALLVAVDLLARLAAPLALVALLRRAPQAALISATIVAALAALRAVVAGRITERSLVMLWDRLIEATRRHGVAALRTRPDIHGAAPLMESAATVAHADTSYAPRVVSDAVGFAAMLLALGAVLSWGWLAAGVLALALASAVVVFAQMRVKRANAVAFDAFAEAAHDFEVLLDAATELRAHGREASHALQLGECVAEMAAAQRRSVGYSAMMGLFPMGLALLVLIAPFGLGAASLADSIGGRIAEAGVLGAAALAFGLGLARAVEGLLHSAPHRRALASYLAVESASASQGDQRVALRDARIELRDLAVRYPGAARDTPGELSYRWPAVNAGVAVTGANGAGKSTLGLCLLGLLRPTQGAVLFDGHDAATLDWPRLRSRVVYVPQDGFVAGDRSVAWHLRHFAQDSHSDAELTAALRQVQLWDLLVQRRGRHGFASGLDTPASQLSGGERKRMQLARALLGSPELVVLDEPEAGLDQASRVWLRQLLATLAGRARVLLIAHDSSIIPEAFGRIACVAREPEARRDGHQKDEARPHERAPEALAQVSVPRDTHKDVAGARRDVQAT